MRFGLMLPSFSFARDYATVGRLRDFATRAEAMGFAGLWVAEHLLTARGLYGTALAVAARDPGVRGRLHAAGHGRHLHPDPADPAIRCSWPRRSPACTCCRAGASNSASGSGGTRGEFAVAGVKLSERGGRTDEILDIFARLWTGDEVTHHGRYYDFDKVAIDPPLPTTPRLWVAGGSKIKTDLSPDPEIMAPTVLERICRRADGWIARAAGSNASVIDDWRQITRRLDEIGRRARR